ncbi:dTMP kinase [Candidatus Purcelliella pentastirinorum]|uniref:Thymidylate kinase n=1 Tax=Candidatus Purcelliella pentastirinorum TaxID=472834 RepID=A0AAX3N930_9ENTR|nr:dTMP kinase [Candidatus Purcelliella pentastirinorum]WDI78622.1 dTMP kinase [Candidatus Purcelliella pentastirinorum]WDR80350.1 dTMP kinase [Candidatus Purcelliella pentastirinorum]
MKGKFIVIEGLEGSGKTTAIKYIINILKKNGILKLKKTREPGSTSLNENLRKLIKNSIKNEIINKNTELLILYAARIQLLETIIKPNLKKGIWIIGDRHNMSSIAYQTGGRKIDRKITKTLTNLFLKNFKPDLTLYLDVTPEIGLNRIKNRKNKDRIEKESLNFFHRTRKCYLKIIKKQKNIKFINANNKIKHVHKKIKFIIENWIKTNNS